MEVNIYVLFYEGEILSMCYLVEVGEVRPNLTVGVNLSVTCNPRCVVFIGPSSKVYVGQF